VDETQKAMDILERLKAIGLTRRKAVSVLHTLMLMQKHGEEFTRNFMSRSTWYKHKALLKQVGVKPDDMRKCNVVPLRQRMIVLGDPVTSWEDLKSRRA